MEIVCSWCRQQGTIEAMHWERYVLRHIQGGEFEPYRLTPPICPGCIDEVEQSVREHVVPAQRREQEVDGA